MPERILLASALLTQNYEGQASVHCRISFKTELGVAAGVILALVCVFDGLGAVRNLQKRGIGKEIERA
ncbi:hypothetical protein C5167_014378 [Papaver somniferum]|uniref:Uncharacterized protein n=1 Tax=Papaver somniferum TaxID=3469 RepID=A0A4Y7J3Y5_PAPSO|nr:hypothetical protein C5167_014378 [Papaver somniferum]